MDDIVHFQRLEQTFPPQQNPTIPHDVISGCVLFNSFMIFGMRSTVFGGAAVVLKNSPSFSPFSFVSGGYQLMSAGEPSKKSGMKTGMVLAWLQCVWQKECLPWAPRLSAKARMSAPWIVWGKKPKMSYTMRIPRVDDEWPAESS